MFKLVYTNQFKRDIKRLQKRRYNMDLIKKAFQNLESNGELSHKFKPHKLSGEYSGFWEAHLKSDWLIIWKFIDVSNEIWLTRTGTHSDLF